MVENENLLIWSRRMTDLHVRVDPWNKVAGLCVDSGEARLGTPVSPGDDTVKTESTHEGSTRVSLARVLAAGIESSTDHGVGDVILAIGISAVIISDNGDIDLHQGASETASLRCGSPSRNGANVSIGIFLSITGDVDGANVAGAEVGILLEVQHADVVLDGPGVVVLVVVDGGDGDVSLVGVILVQVVASNSDSKSAGRLSEIVYQYNVFHFSINN